MGTAASRQARQEAGNVRAPPDIFAAVYEYLTVHRTRCREFFAEFAKVKGHCGACSCACQGHLTRAELERMVRKIVPGVTPDEMRYFRAVVRAAPQLSL